MKLHQGLNHAPEIIEIESDQNNSNKTLLAFSPVGLQNNKLINA